MFSVRLMEIITKHFVSTPLMSDVAVGGTHFLLKLDFGHNWDFKSVSKSFSRLTKGHKKGQHNR